jgi:hypothetical protein
VLGIGAGVSVVTHTLALPAGALANAGAANLALAKALLPDTHAAEAVALDLLAVLPALLVPGIDSGSIGETDKGYCERRGEE